jgi:hypothetical protein
VAVVPGVLMPLHRYQTGAALAGDVYYGVAVGRAIVAPGARVAVYAASRLGVLAALATTRASLPLGPLEPYLLAGFGPGWVSRPSEAGLAWLAGGGLMVRFEPCCAHGGSGGLRIGVGVEASYQAVTGTPFKAAFVGPALRLGF